MSDDWRDADGNLDPQLIGHDIETLGHAWAGLSHAASLLDKTQTAVFAQMVLAHMEEHSGVSRATAELKVRGSDDWMNHIYAALDARRRANVALVNFEAGKARFEAMRTQEASRRVEMTTLGRR